MRGPTAAHQNRRGRAPGAARRPCGVTDEALVCKTFYSAITSQQTGLTVNFTRQSPGDFVNLRAVVRRRRRDGGSLQRLAATLDAQEAAHWEGLATLLAELPGLTSLSLSHCGDLLEDVEVLGGPLPEVCAALALLCWVR